MSKKSHTIVDMAEVWDELTPRQQLMMIQRASILAGHNKLRAMGVQNQSLHSSLHEEPVILED